MIRFLSALAAAMLLVGGVADATQITRPSASPFVVPAGAQAFTVVATGFVPGSHVYVEQCDGVPPTAIGWDPTLDCDLGSAPPPATADETGTATFAGKIAFEPFVGESPQAIFNCVAPGQRAPANNLKTFTNCKLRVSSNNASVTSDQVFRTLVLPASARPAQTDAASSTTTVASNSTARNKTGSVFATKKKTNAKRTTTTTTVPGARPIAQLEAPRHNSSSSSTSSGALLGYVLVLTGLAVAGSTMTGRERRGAAR